MLEGIYLIKLLNDKSELLLKKFRNTHQLAQRNFRFSVWTTICNGLIFGTTTQVVENVNLSLLELIYDEFT
jgi:hypothetical protein